MRTELFVVETGREAVYDVCTAILEDGREVSPRGQRTRELSPVHIELANPADTLPTGINRARLLPAIAAAEALQNIAGKAQPALMHRVSKFFPRPTGRWGEGVVTYGERMGRQLHDALVLLRRDPDTREAVVAVCRPGDMIAGQAHNLCTTTLQFLRRNGALDLLVTMRSNDAWYGLCYDLFQFAQVQLTMARALGIPAGRYFHTAASLHLYERHWEAAAALTPPPPGELMRVDGLGVAPGDDWYRARLRAESLLNGFTPVGATETERWYAATLGPYEPDGS